MTKHEKSREQRRSKRVKNKSESASAISTPAGSASGSAVGERDVGAGWVGEHQYRLHKLFGSGFGYTIVWVKFGTGTAY